MDNPHLPVAIIGGGPVGLAAAAHLSARQEPFMLFEAGDAVAAGVLQWSHVRVFSPWKYNIDKTAASILGRIGWSAPDGDGLPTGQELYDHYLKPLADHPLLRPFIRTSSRVISIGRKGIDKMKSKNRDNLPFVITVQQHGKTVSFEARAVIDATSTWQNPNPLGSGGIAAAGEAENRKKIFYGIPDVTGKAAARYQNKSVLVVGGGHSAINTILGLDELKREHPRTQIHWVLRKNNLSDVFGGREADALPARGELGMRIERLIMEDRISVYSPFHIGEISEAGGLLNVTGTQAGARFVLAGINEIIANTGSRPDFSFLREVRAEYDPAIECVPAIAGLIDPNIHSCGTVRPHGEAELRQKEKDLYVAGAKSYGRAPTFLMATGYEQVRSIVAALAGDWAAAAKVELDLPETGVCSAGAGGGECCAVEHELVAENTCC